MKYYSQSNQDKWVCELFKFKKDGYFVDVGASNGIHINNTYCLEQFLNWNGICIEADTNIFNQLTNNRKCLKVNAAVSDKNGTCEFLLDSLSKQHNVMECTTLDYILEKCKAPQEIDYISIDIEGMEYQVLSALNFNKWNIKSMTIEHNSYLEGEFNKNRIFELLTKNGFTRVVNDVLCLESHPSVHMKPYEDWYVNNNFLQYI